MESLTRLVCLYSALRSEELDAWRKFHSVDKNEPDRLSSLPDALVQNILSLVDTKSAVQTCVLSKRWQRQWTYVHSLDFDERSFSRCIDFKEFVSNVLQHRESTKVRKLKFSSSTIRVNLVRTVFQYAISHGVEEIEANILDKFPGSISEWKTDLYQCQTLKNISCRGTMMGISLGKFVALKSLRLKDTRIRCESDVFRDCYLLETLVVENCSRSGKFIQISAPNMISLTFIFDIKYNFSMFFLITAPKLKFVFWNGPPCMLKFREGHVLEELRVETVADSLYSRYARQVKGMVQHFCSAKSVSVLVDVSRVSRCWYIHYTFH